MDRELELNLIAAALERAGTAGPPLDDDEAFVDVAEYTDADRFVRERERIFRPALNVVGLSTAVAAPGDFLTVDIVGTPAIIVRGDDGRVQAFVNVCRHRGATVERRAAGRCKHFVCPYHAWTYRTDGGLQHVRHPEGFPSLRVADTSLVPLSCHEGAGLIFVCPDPAVTHDGFDEATRQLLTELEGVVGPSPTAFASTSRNWDANWKLITDGGLESYHFRIAHRDTIGSRFLDTMSSYAFIGEHIRSVLPRRTLVELADVPRETWRLRDHANMVYTIDPNAMLLIQDSHFELIRSTPLSVGRTRVDLTTVGRAPGPDGLSDRARAFLQGNHDFTVRTLDEDFELAARIQAGLHTGANERLRFGRFEGALSQWHRRLEARLARPAWDR